MRASARDIRPAYTARPGEAIRVFYDDADGSYGIGGGRMAVASRDMTYVAAVIDDLTQIAFSASGEAVLREGDSVGHRVRIVRPNPPTEPANAWIIPDDLAAATSGAGCGSTIAYDPADWPRAGDRTSPTSSQILLLMLRQANTNAVGKSVPSEPNWGTVA